MYAGKFNCMSVIIAVIKIIFLQTTNGLKTPYSSSSTQSFKASTKGTNASGSIDVDRRLALLSGITSAGAILTSHLSPAVAATELDRNKSLEKNYGQAKPIGTKSTSSYNTYEIIPDDGEMLSPSLRSVEVCK